MAKTKRRETGSASIDNIYTLDGKVPLLRSIPFGLQHVLAMFVANIAPIMIVSSACGLTAQDTACLIQTAMLMAGIGTLIQLFTVWKIGAKLPIVMGISFTFVSILCCIGPKYGYGAVVGAVIVGGIIEGLLGFFAQYWRKIISPIVAACVVTAIGFSLLSVGANSFAGGSGAENFGSWQNWLLGSVTLVACILFNIVVKGHWKQLAVLFGLVVGYIVALGMGMVDFSALEGVSVISLPEFLPYKPTFNLSAIISVTMIFLVSATETIGDTSALTSSVLGREVTDKEISGSLACDGFVSSLSALFGLLGSVTLVACILFNIVVKGHWKQLAVLFGLVVGYIVALGMGMVDFSALEGVSVISLPEFLPYKPTFNLSAIISVTMIFLVSATETIGDTSALTSSVLGREVTDKEISGSLACDGFVSSLSALFGCLPITSFSQNVGLLAMTKVINRVTIATGAGIMLLAGIFPAVGAILTTLPEAVLGGCTIMMFGNIVVSGLQMIGNCGYTQRNITIAALSLSIGIGFTQVPEMFAIFPDIVRTIFAENCVAVVFVAAILLNLVMPKEKAPSDGTV